MATTIDIYTKEGQDYLKKYINSLLDSNMITGLNVDVDTTRKSSENGAYWKHIRTGTKTLTITLYSEESNDGNKNRD